MDTKNSSSSKQPKHERSAFAGWGAIGGALLGAIVGLVAGHWLLWAGGIAVAGWIGGGLLDRSRL